MSDILPEGLVARPATLDDIASIYRLFQDQERALYGYTDKILAMVQAAYTAPELDLVKDSCLVFDRAGQLVGSMLLEQSMYARFNVTICVFSRDRDPRLGDYLVDLAERRAQAQMEQAQPGARVTMYSWIASLDQDGLQCFQQAGFREVRRNWRMEIELHEAPATPVWPEGVELRPFVPKRDNRAVFEMVETAFQEHWDYEPGDFAEWERWTNGRADFDPSLWPIAWASAQPVGCALCSVGPPGWINTVAVARAWRDKGLGLALLQSTFGEFYRRDLRRVGLAVDSKNITGATRLYQRAGMRRTREYLNMEKELRAGRN